MARLILVLLLIAPPPSGSSSSTALAQTVKDCSNCSNAEWGAEWNPATGQCAGNPSLGCGVGCNCHMGFYQGYGLSTKPEFFGGAFTEDGGFRIDRPGPLSINRVAPGDIAFRINGHKPRLSDFGTPKRPTRRISATWDSQGRLWLRLQR